MNYIYMGNVYYTTKEQKEYRAKMKIIHRLLVEKFKSYPEFKKCSVCRFLYRGEDNKMHLVIKGKERLCADEIVSYSKGTYSYVENGKRRCFWNNNEITEQAFDRIYGERL